jgi:hypothetical protein
MSATMIVNPSQQVPTPSVCVDEVTARGGLGSGPT